ncbi:hypothetical protein LguiB_032105 [Lonicera macranthoides]
MHMDTSVKCKGWDLNHEIINDLTYFQGATWDPDERMILIAFPESSTLASIHFASKPPSLDAHLLPVDLPEIQSLTGR